MQATISPPACAKTFHARKDGARGASERYDADRRKLRRDRLRAVAAIVRDQHDFAVGRDERLSLKGAKTSADMPLFVMGYDHDGDGHWLNHQSRIFKSCMVAGSAREFGWQFLYSQHWTDLFVSRDGSAFRSYGSHSQIRLVVTRRLQNGSRGMGLEGKMAHPDLARAVRSIDLALRQHLGIREFTEDEGCIFRISPSSSCADVCLSDGTQIYAGDPLLQRKRCFAPTFHDIAGSVNLRLI
jgi:hypothetical protein